MAIAEQFAGLEMDKLIGGPLSAAADASILMANSTADFINRVGFDAEGKVRTATFMYERRSVNEDGTSNLDEMKVNVPMLAIVPIPNLQIDEVNVLFDMEVKQSEKQDTSMDLGATVSGTLNLGVVKISVTGSVSAHSSNTRSSDNSAKYHVDIRATNHGTPEGMARVLDMIAANISPSLSGSSMKDGNGQDLSEAARIKAERLKALRQEIQQTERRLSAATDSLDSHIGQIKKIASTQQNVYQGAMMRLMNGLNKDDESDQQKAEAYSQTMDEINQSWSALQNQAADLIKMVADSAGTDSGKTENAGVSELFALKALSPDGKTQDYKEGESCYRQLMVAQNNAISSRSSVSQIETQLFDKKAEYSDAISGKAPVQKLEEEKGGTSGGKKSNTATTK